MPTVKTKQQFKHGDLVRIADDLGPSMSHFNKGCDAIVIKPGSNYSEDTGRDMQMYTLYIKGEGEHSWYFGWQLTLIHPNQKQLLATWKKELADLTRQQTDLDWIFANGEALVNSCPGASVQALGDCMRTGSLWGSRGEGIDLYLNSLAVMQLATPFLQARDKAGWLHFCETRRRDEIRV